MLVVNRSRIENGCDFVDEEFIFFQSFGLCIFISVTFFDGLIAVAIGMLDRHWIDEASTACDLLQTQVNKRHGHAFGQGLMEIASFV